MTTGEPGASITDILEGINPISFAIVFHRLQTINKEMGIAMVRTSRSPIFAEVHDFSCAICDWESNIISQVDGVPSHTASSMVAAKAIAQTFAGDIHPGDVFIINDAYTGGTHLADVTIIKPVFYQGSLLFMTINRAHHSDVGGMSAGSYSPFATEIFHEGIRIPPVRIFRNNQPIRDVVELIKINTRMPETLWSDIRAQVASCDVGEKRLLEMVDKLGLETMKKAVKAAQAYAEQRMRQEIRKMPDGEYEGEACLDDDGFGREQIRIKVKITISGEEIYVDFTGTDPQTKGFINSPFANSCTSVYVAVLTTASGEVPHTEGAYRPIRIFAPEGTVVNPLPPAPVASCTLDTACAILEATWMALSRAIPERVPAGWNRKSAIAISGISQRTGDFFVHYNFACKGGAGAMPHMDGLHYLGNGIDLGGLLAPNVESDEIDSPISTEVYELLPDSGGAGKFRGGLGVHFRARYQADNLSAVLWGDGQVNAPYGLFGGKPGRNNRSIFNAGTEMEELPSNKGTRQLKKGDTYTLLASGGGGWGNPLEREVERVRDDVLNGFVSIKSAYEDYGVVLGDNLEVDREATHALREAKGK